MDMSVKLEAFEGPLDLLLHLIEKNKVDIYDIPIVEITDQYLYYIGKMPYADPDSMSEFLVMGTTLLSIKCRMLLPASPDDEEDEDPRAELAEQLMQYKLCKYVSEELKSRQVDTAQVIYRSPDIPGEVKEYEQPVDMDSLLENLTLNGIRDIFCDVMNRREDKIDPVRSKFGKIEKEEVSLKEKFTYLRTYFRAHSRCSFRQLLEEQHSKMHVVVTFLAMLEMMRQGEIRARQEETFGEIYIERSALANGNQQA